MRWGPLCLWDLPLLSFFWFPRLCNSFGWGRSSWPFSSSYRIPCARSRQRSFYSSITSLDWDLGHLLSAWPLTSWLHASVARRCDTPYWAARDSTSSPRAFSCLPPPDFDAILSRSACLTPVSFDAKCSTSMRADIRSYGWVNQYLGSVLNPRARERTRTRS